MQFRHDPIVWTTPLVLLSGLFAVASLDGIALEISLRTICFVVGACSGILIWKHRTGLPPRERLAMGLVAASLGLWSVGIGVHLVDLAQGRVVSNYLPADIFMILGTVVGIAGVARIPTGKAEPDGRKLQALDQIIAALSSGVVFWHLAIAPNIHHWSDQSLLRMGLSMLYPIAEFVILQAIVDLLVRGSNRRELLWATRWAIVGIGSLLAGNIVLELDIPDGPLAGRQILHATNLVFATAMLLAARSLSVRDASRPMPPRHGWIALRESVIPLVWIAIPAITLAWDLLLGGPRPSWDLLAALVVLVVLVVVRQTWAQPRLRSSLRSAMLSFFLPAMLGFHMASFVAISLILSIHAERSAKIAIMLETARLAQTHAWPDLVPSETERLFGPGSSWHVAGQDSAPSPDDGANPPGRRRGVLTRTANDFRRTEIVAWADIPGEGARRLVVVSPLGVHLRDVHFPGFLVMCLFLFAATMATSSIFRRARNLATPLERLTRAAVEAENGDLEVRTRIDGTDEVGRLGHAMDAMLERLGSVLDEQRELAERAREASSAKSRFLANMSHEIRTPLNGIVGIAELLSTSDLPQHASELVAGLKSSAENLRTLVGDILDLSKIEAEKVSLEHVPFSPSQLLEDVAAFFRPLADAQDIELRCAWTTPPPAAMIGDPVKIRQILANLVSNAIKFTPRGGVHVRAHVRKDGPRALVVEVEDTGEGIAPEARDRIWQPFAQADESTTRRFGGTGLGLSISRSLARLMGGDLVLAGSEPGKGSLFVLETPYTESTQAVPEATSAPMAAETAPPNLHVVVAEDNRVNQKVIIGFLRKLGNRTSLAEDGEEAVATVLREHPDLVLMDVHMPRMDGIEATRRLREAGYQGRIWALTASALEEERQRSLEAGMDGFMVKPISMSDLRTVLGSLKASRA